MEEFMPLGTLIETKPDELTPEQYKVVARHVLARKFRDNVEAWKQHKRLTAQQRESVERLERQAEEAGQLAVTAAVGYYIQHGHLEDSYEDVRRVAAAHWSGKINRRWAGFFTNAFTHHYAKGKIDLRQVSEKFVSRVDRNIKVGLLTDRLAKMLRRGQGTGGQDVKTDLGELQRRGEIAAWISESETLGQRPHKRRELPN